MANINPEATTSAVQTLYLQQESPADPKLASLRDLAQQHLDEIDAMAQNEQMQEKRRVEELEREAKRRGRGHQRRSPDAEEQGDGKRSKMRTAQGNTPFETKSVMHATENAYGCTDVLDRLRWDPSLKIEDHRVGYIDRFGGIQELLVSQWIRESTEEEWIPQHRIRYFKRLTKGDGAAKAQKMEEDVVWHREQRIDKIFGSR